MFKLGSFSDLTTDLQFATFDYSNPSCNRRENQKPSGLPEVLQLKGSTGALAQTCLCSSSTGAWAPTLYPVPTGPCSLNSTDSSRF